MPLGTRAVTAAMYGSCMSMRMAWIRSNSASSKGRKYSSRLSWRRSSATNSALPISGAGCGAGPARPAGAAAQGLRGSIGVIVSEDEGITWSSEAIIHDDWSGEELGYPVATQLDDGRIFTAYYFG